MVESVKVYAVRDLKGNMFDVPFFARGDLFASHKFIMDIRSRRETMVSSFKDDFELVCLGEFDMVTGEFSQNGKVAIVKGCDVELTGDAS